MSMYDYTPQAFAGWTNFGFTSNIDAINEGFNYGIKALYDVHDIFYTKSNISCMHYNETVYPLTLRDNYMDLWNDKLPLLTELFYVNKSVFGFFLGDEIMWNGISPQQITIAARTIKQNFSSAIIYRNAATTPVETGRYCCTKYFDFTHISPYLDWFSIDMYHFNGPNESFVDSVKQFYEKYVFTKMNLTYQYGLTVPGSFGSDQNNECNETRYDEMCSVDAKNFYEWGLNDDRIIGINPWHWGFCPSCVGHFEDEIGTQNLTLTQQAWKEYGKDIITSMS